MKQYLLFLPVFLILSTAVYAANEIKSSASADLMNAKGEKIAHAVLTQEGDGVRIAVDVKNLEPGLHAFHIHNVGSCVAPDFKSAGPHFNPSKKEHGLENPKGHHAGDMPNFNVPADGTAHAEVVNKEVSLDASGVNSLFHEGGTALVIHAKADDGKTDPAGSAGDRVACGVITKS